MSKANKDQKTQKQTEVKQPVEMNDGELDEIAGGPHLVTADSLNHHFSALDEAGVRRTQSDTKQV